MKFFLLAIVLVGLSQTYAQSFGRCVDTPVLKDFDATKYLGKWFEIERFDYIFERNLQCVRAEYGLDGDKVTVHNSGYNTNKQRFDTVEGHAFVANIEEPNKLKVKLPVKIANFTLFKSTGNYHVIDTDYENYALVYSCTQFIPYVAKLEVAWILSRSKTLDQNKVKYLKDLAKSYNIDVTKFIVIDQSCE